MRRHLLTAIVDGTLVAGERLHDDELIAWLGVSRTPIRTALERLAEIGLIDMEPNRFTRVAVPTRGSLLDALALYAALHAWAAEELVPLLDDEGALEVTARFGAVRALADRATPWVWTRADLETIDHAVGFFSHRAGNPILMDLLFEVRVRLVVSFASLAMTADVAAIALLADAIAAAVDARDGRAAGEALRAGLSSRLVPVSVATAEGAHGGVGGLD